MDFSKEVPSNDSTIDVYTHKDRLLL